MRRLFILMVAVVLSVTITVDSTEAASKHKMERLIRKTFPDYIEDTMVCIAKHESGLNPRAINWSDRHTNGHGSFGLFQIGRIHVWMVGGNWRRFLIPEVNVRLAYRLWKKNGLDPWRSTKNGC